jgi:hypothetical protein
MGRLIVSQLSPRNAALAFPAFFANIELSSNQAEYSLLRDLLRFIDDGYG